MALGVKMRPATRRTRSLRFVAEALLVGTWMILTGLSPVLGQPSNIRVAIFTPGRTLGRVHEGLEEGLARLGYKKGRNVIFIVDDTQENTSDLVGRAAKLLAAKPDVVFAVTGQHAIAAKQATTAVPIVFAWIGDPVREGLVASYASSKNNLTGVTSTSDSLSGKRLEVLLELAPKIKRLLTIVASGERIALNSFRFLYESAKKFRVELVRRDVASEKEIERALQEIPKGAVDAIYHIPSNLMRSRLDLLVEKAKRDRIPLAVHDDSLVEVGALVSYGPSPRLVGVQAAALMDKVLKGTKPSEIVIETPNRFFFAINLTVAKEIGLKIPREVLEEADRLVE